MFPLVLFQVSWWGRHSLREFEFLGLNLTVDGPAQRQRRRPVPCMPPGQKALKIMVMFQPSPEHFHDSIPRLPPCSLTLARFICAPRSLRGGRGGGGEEGGAGRRPGLLTFPLYGGVLIALFQREVEPLSESLGNARPPMAVATTATIIGCP